MKLLSGMLIRSVALMSVLAATNVQAQNSQTPLAAGRITAPLGAPGALGGRPAFTPQPLYPAGPGGATPAVWNQSYGGHPMMLAPANYQGVPQGMPVYPASYGAPGQEPSVNSPIMGPPSPDPMGMGGGYGMGPQMGGPQMGGPQMGGFGMGGMDASGYGMPGMESGYGMGGGGCPSCGGGGCGACGNGNGIGNGHGQHHGILGGFLRRLLPYAEGGACAPRWYDISVDGLYWTRDEVSDSVPFSAFTRFGPTVLSTDDVAYEKQPGVRVSANLQVLPGVALDLGYTGGFSYSGGASVSSPINELFSPYSGFGALIGVGLPFDESDQAQFQSIRTSSTIDSFEISVRKFWTGPNCRLQGSYRSGVRYVYLVDDLNYFTLGRNVPIGLGVGPAGSSSTDVRTHNSLVGWQAGFDLWANIVPGVSVGSDLRAGVYGNHAKYNTRVFGSTTAGGVSADLFETNTNDDIAVVGEFNLLFIWRTGPNFTIRGGYTGLFIDGVALAPENFNSANPFNTTRPVIATDTDGDVLYHGGFLGFEYMW